MGQNAEGCTEEIQSNSLSFIGVDPGLPNFVPRISQIPDGLRNGKNRKLHTKTRDGQVSSATIKPIKIMSNPTKQMRILQEKKTTDNTKAVSYYPSGFYLSPEVPCQPCWLRKNYMKYSFGSSASAQVQEHDGLNGVMRRI